MTLPPGMPERGGFADRFQEIERRLSAVERQNSIAPKILSGQDDASNFSLTTSFQTVCTVSLTFPEWVEQAIVFSSAWGTLSATDETDEVLQMQIIRNSGAVVAGPLIMPVPLQGVAGTGSLALSAAVVETVSGAVLSRLQARNSTSYTGNSFGLSVVGIGLS